MRMIVGGQQRLYGATAEPPVPQQQDNTLGLMHLRKLFAEFKHPAASASQKELEDKLYNMLPLFCKVGLPFFYILHDYSHVLVTCYFDVCWYLCGVDNTMGSHTQFLFVGSNPSHDMEELGRSSCKLLPHPTQV